MGHGSDKLYITHGEHTSGLHGASSTGAKSKRPSASFQRLPYNACALSLKTVETPVCTSEGDLFELLAIIPWIREHGTNPVTGKPMVAGDLLKVHFFFNSDGHEHDPVTFKVFNEHTPLVVIKTTGNVFSRETIDLLNIKAKHWRDLMTDVEFKREDIITLQDPLNVEARDLSRFDHIKNDIKPPSAASKAKASGSGPENSKTAGLPAPVPHNASLVSSGRTAASFTSTSQAIQTETENALWDEEDLMFEAIQAKGEKAFVRLITNYGNLNLELYCGIAPRTCYNFLKLAAEDKYKDTTFHRLIPGFMLQGGDPTGTGRGGSSIWGQPFDDEFQLRNAHKHDDRGTLSMANSGPNTNSSQFFLTFRPTPHLDGKHTVFGRLVGGEDILAKIERVPVDPATNRPLKPVTLKDVAIFADPYDVYKKKLEKRIVREQEEREGAGIKAAKKAEREKDRTTWFGTDLSKPVPTAVMQVGLGGPAVVRNGAESVPLGYPTSSNNQSSGYFSPPPINYTSSYSSPMGDTLMSPRLAMPPTAVQRSGSNASFDPYPPSVSTSRPSYPQPHLNGFANPSSTNGSSSSMPTLPRTRSEFGDLQAQSSQSYTSYNAPRTSIDYPQLRSPALPTSSRPAYPSTAPLPHTLTRPPAIQPAPIRSNSSFALPNSYPTSSQSKFISNYTFGDDAIGLTGLKNLGNTCYMNSTIQCLSATIPFAKYFKEGGFKRDVNRVNPLGTKGALADAVSELIRAMWAQNYLFLSPVTFRDQICRFASQFRGSDQHDAQEFLGFLLDGLHEDLNYIVQKPPPVEMTPEREHDLETLPAQVMSSREWDIYRRRDDSFVVQCFQGQFRNQMKCLTCSKTSTTYNTFMPLSIPVPSGRGISKVTLQDCISAFVREEILDKDDAWFCPRCKKARKTSKKLSLSRLPPILVIHLKRFSFHGPFSDKIETQVQYPLSGLDLTSYVPPPLFDPRAPPPSGPPKGHVYDLYGVTNHYGNLSSGHYTAYVRNHNEWNHIGDSKVSAATPQMVESNRNSYILWYRKV